MAVYLNTFIELHAPLLWSNTTCADTFHLLQSARDGSVCIARSAVPSVGNSEQLTLRGGSNV